MKDKIRALIIGCGKMGAFYDSPGSKEISSHAHALKKAGAELYFYDKKPLSAKKAAKVWSGKSLQKLNDKVTPFDVIVLACPTAEHFHSIQKLLTLAPAQIIVEKPFCQSLKEAMKSERQLLKRHQGLWINYSRLYHPEYRALYDLVHKKEWGALIRVDALYSRGMLNNGSHLLSLLTLFFGKMKQFQKVRSYKEKVSGLMNVDFVARFSKGGVLSVASTENSQLSVWTFRLLFEKAQIDILDFGQNFKITKIVDTLLTNDVREINVDLNQCLTELYKINISDTEKKWRASILKATLETHSVISKIERSK